MGIHTFYIQEQINSKQTKNQTQYELFLINAPVAILK